MAGEIGRTLDLVLRRLTEAVAAVGSTVPLRIRGESATLDLAARRTQRTVDEGAQRIEQSAPMADEPRRSVVPHPLSGRKRVFEPSAGELMMRRRRLVPPPPGQRPALPDPRMKTRQHGLDGREVPKQVWRMESTDGGHNVFKPFTGEIRMRIGIPEGGGQQAAREVLTYRVDQMLGFGRVPPTAVVDGPEGYGRGSIMDFVPSKDGRSITKYDKLQRHQMAVLDYIIGNTDRHAGNYRTVTSPDGPQIVAIDHGLTFPERPDPHFGIRSDFVTAQLNQALHPDVLDAVKQLHPDQLRSAASDFDLSPQAVEGAVARLQEIQMHGKITGEKWPGSINWCEEVPDGPPGFQFIPYRT
ncbi:protein kinase family protein [Nocardia sp. X0981]